MCLIAGFITFVLFVFGLVQRLPSAVEFLIKMFVLNTNGSDFLLKYIRIVSLFTLFCGYKENI